MSGVTFDLAAVAALAGVVIAAAAFITRRLDKRFDRLDQRMDRLEERMDRLEERVDALARDMGNLRQDVGRLQGIVERTHEPHRLPGAAAVARESGEAYRDAPEDAGGSGKD